MSTYPSAPPSTAGGFLALGLSPRLTSALSRAGVTTPFPIQAATLPDSLAGRDVLGRGRTGSGKTYAFALPILDRLAGGRGRRLPSRPRALILAPTRELASQIDSAMSPLAKELGLRTVTVFGGVGAQPQITALRAGVDIVIACPGRLVDHLQSGHVKLDNIEITVVDEADHMADLGFLPVVRRLLDATPKGGQRMLFSATLDAAVNVLVNRFMRDPVTHSVDSARSQVDKMTHHVLHVGSDARVPVLVDLASAPGRTLVFTRTKHGARSLARRLTAAGVPSVELHGNLSQGARTRNLALFSSGRAPTMVATDIAARGIHVDDIGLVVHADPPIEHKAYLHRSGRTARAGASGIVVTLMTDAQVRDVRDLTRKAGVAPTTTRVHAGHPLLEKLAPGARVLVTPGPPAREPAQQARGGGRHSRGGSAGGSRRRTPSSRGRQDGVPQPGGRPARRPSRRQSVDARSGSDAGAGAAGASTFSSGMRGVGRRRGR